MRDRSLQHVCWALRAGILGLALLHSPAYADLVGTDQIIAHEQAQQQRERVKALMSRADVAKQLRALGVSPDSAQARLDAITDEEIRSIAGKLDTLPAGGALGTYELILILLVVILVVILI